MKYFFLHIWILPLVRGIFSLTQGDQPDFNLKTDVKLMQNHISTKNNHPLKKIKFPSDLFPSKYIKKRQVDLQTLSSVVSDVRQLLEPNKILDSNKRDKKVVRYPIGESPIPRPSCKIKSQVPLSLAYNKVVCQQVPGRIVCQAGKTTFVISNGEHQMTPDIVQKFIVMANQRYGEGDENFDVSVNEADTTICPCYPTVCGTTPCATEAYKDEIPIIIECNLMSNKKLKMCNPYYNPLEKIYQCKAKKLGIKKRSPLHIAVNKNGTVSYIPNPLFHECNNRRKRELDRPGLHEMKDDSDHSNFYYHTNKPYIRNYTDFCTMKNIKSWCQEYISENPCKITKLDTFKLTVRPCRDALENSMVSAVRIPDGKKYKDKLETINTVEVSKNKPFLKLTSNEIDRKKRHRTHLNGRRLFKKTRKLGKKNEQQLSIHSEDNRNLNSVRNSREYYATIVNIGSSNELTSSSQQSITMAQLVTGALPPFGVVQPAAGVLTAFGVVQPATGAPLPFVEVKPEVGSTTIPTFSVQATFGLQPPTFPQPAPNPLQNALPATCNFFTPPSETSASHLCSTNNDQPTDCAEFRYTRTSMNNVSSYETTKSYLIQLNSVKQFHKENNSETESSVSIFNTSLSKSKVLFEKDHLFNVQYSLDHSVNLPEIKSSEVPSFGQSEQSFIILDKEKLNEIALREHRNSRNTKVLLNDLPHSIKTHTRRRRKLSLFKKFNLKKKKPAKRWMIRQRNTS